MCQLLWGIEVAAAETSQFKNNLVLVQPPQRIGPWELAVMSSLQPIPKEFNSSEFPQVMKDVYLK